MKLSKNSSNINYQKSKIAFLAVGSLAVAYFLIIPSIKKIRANFDIFISQRIELEKQLEKEKKYTNLSKKLDKIDPMLPKINNLFLNDNSELDLITSLEAIADKNFVKQTIDINQSSSKKKKDSQKQIVTLNVSGNFVNLYHYLQDLESSNYYLYIKELSINGSQIQTQSTDTNIPSNLTETKPLMMNIVAEIVWG